jgi:hypothetical protein
MESNKKYLVGVCAHIDTEEKFNQLVEQLGDLNKAGLDVCLSINTKNYLSELSGYVKYLVYHGDNDIIDQEFYIENAEICHNTYGYVVYQFWTEKFSVSYTIPFRGHSKPAFKLWANSFYIAWQNGYDWICHIEYDVKKPLMGWEKYFGDIINNLEESNNKAFYYIDNGTLWGLCFVLSSSICEDKLLQETRNIITKKDWVKYWGNAVAECCLSVIIDSKFSGSIITKPVSDSIIDIWGTSNPSEVHYSAKKTSEDGIDNSLINKGEPEVVHIYPNKTDTGYELFLLQSCNMGHSTKAELLNTRVYYDEEIIYQDPSTNLYSGHWRFSKLPPYYGIKRITLSYEKKLGEKTLSYSESFSTEKIEYLWSNIMRLIPHGTNL